MKNLQKQPIIELEKIFCYNLKFLRESKELTQKILAQNLNIPVSTYANWEQGRTQPSIYDIFKIIEKLDIQANDLFDKDGYKIIKNSNIEINNNTNTNITINGNIN